MIEVTIKFDDDDELSYTADMVTRDVSGGDPDGDLVLLLVDEALESGEFIGPQVDEFVGAGGNWDNPINVVAAFMDAATKCGGQVTSWDMSDDDRAAAAAAVAEEDPDDK